MKTGFYAKLAVSGILKNRKTYFPYIFTCIGMVMMYYILSFLSKDEMLLTMPGGEILLLILTLGTVIITVFAGIFLFYTNSFLIRHRKKEFGLYNILGMNKKNISRILIWETFLIYLVSAAGGLLCGILFSKLAQLVMVKMLGMEANYVFGAKADCMKSALVWFAVIFLLILANAIRQIHLAKPVELLHSQNTGEKPPRVKWLFAAAGAVIMAYAYYIALTIEEPIEAIFAFFGAVIMVIAATYLLFMAGSVALCKILQKCKGYYYKTNHFIAVSSMAYRMKRNGAGLASICILCTMVLVMISSTACLYFGMENSLRSRYPRNITVETYSCNPEYTQQVHDAIEETLNRHGLKPQNVMHYRYLPIAGFIQDSTIIFDRQKLSAAGVNYSEMKQFFVVPVEDYNRLMGADEVLADQEALVYTTKSTSLGDEFTIENFGSFQVKKHITEFADNGIDAMQMMSSVFLFVKDMDVVNAVDALQKAAYGDNASMMRDYYGMDLDCGESLQSEVTDEIGAAIGERQARDGAFPAVKRESVAKERMGFYSLYAGLFFLGILLGFVFIVAAVLIMYYKQITEGYEDQERFDILKKVGMTDKEIRSSINSQMLMVFFIPLVTAGIHVAAAFKMIAGFLDLFNLHNKLFLMAVTACCFIVFALFYVIVYRMTSRAYYHIVDGREH